jgi:hypothetical protein
MEGDAGALLDLSSAPDDVPDDDMLVIERFFFLINDQYKYQS